MEKSIIRLARFVLITLILVILIGCGKGVSSDVETFIKSQVPQDLTVDIISSKSLKVTRNSEANGTTEAWCLTLKLKSTSSGRTTDDKVVIYRRNGLHMADTGGMPCTQIETF